MILTGTSSFVFFRTQSVSNGIHLNIIDGKRSIHSGWLESGWVGLMIPPSPNPCGVKWDSWQRFLAYSRITKTFFLWRISLLFSYHMLVFVPNWTPCNEVVLVPSRYLTWRVRRSGYKIASLLTYLITLNFRDTLISRISKNREIKVKRTINVANIKRREN